MALTLLCSLLASAAPDAEPGAMFKTPQAVFTAMQKASAKKDFASAVACIAPTARKDVAAQLAAHALALRSSDNPAVVKAAKPMLDVLAKHGLTEKATGRFDASDMAAARKKAAALIKKPDAFAADMMAAQDRMTAAVGLGGAPLPKMKLAELKIDGARAGAVIVTEIGGAEVRQPIRFVRTPDGWRVLPADPAPEHGPAVEESRRDDKADPG